MIISIVFLLSSTRLNENFEMSFRVCFEQPKFSFESPITRILINFAVQFRAISRRKKSKQNRAFKRFGTHVILSVSERRAISIVRPGVETVAKKRGKKEKKKPWLRPSSEKLYACIFIKRSRPRCQHHQLTVK